jgi:N-acetylmuramoyl-L-alanine amidase
MKSMEKYKKIDIVLDPAHDDLTPGKRSPDGRHREYKWSRMICSELDIVLRALKYNVYFTTSTNDRLPLAGRRKFAENLKSDNPKLLLSIHNNAAGDGSDWKNARGVEIFTREGVDKADLFADILFDKAKEWFPTIKHRYASDELYKRDKENKLYMTNSPLYWGVLLEWLFQDNKDDLLILENTKFNKALVDCIVDAVEEFNNKI